MKYKKYVLLFFVAGSLVLFAGCTKRAEKMPSTTEAATEQEISTQEKIEFSAVIQEMDRLQNKIRLMDMTTGAEYTFAYHGGVDVTNRYGEIMAIARLEVGMIVRIGCDTARQTLVSVQVHPDAVCYEDVTNMKLDLTGGFLWMADTRLDFAESMLVYDGNALVSADTLDDQDQVDLWTYAGELYAVVVKLGHGYLELSNYDTYEGGMLEVGDVIVPVTKNLVLTVREGDYQLRITKGTHVGTRYVTVTRNVQTKVDLIGLQISPDPTGAIRIEVSPADCNPQITVDNVLYQADEEITLAYGRHMLRVQAAGYETYAVYLDVQQAYKKYKITMQPEGGAETTQSETTAEGTTKASSEQNSHKITIAAPSGAKLYVDGEYVGETPCSFTKTAGSHIITLTRTGCLAASYTITAVENGQDDTYSYDELTTLGNALED